MTFKCVKIWRPMALGNPDIPSPRVLWRNNDLILEEFATDANIFVVKHVYTIKQFVRGN